MKTKKDALKELTKKKSTSYNKAFYYGFKAAIAFIFEDATIYKSKPDEAED